MMRSISAAERTVAETVHVRASPERAYRAIADFGRMADWSPEFVGAWTGRRGPVAGARFVGFNRRGPLLWFTTGRITVADPGREFRFRVTAFGVPTAVWGYRIEPAPGGAEVTEYWEYLGRGSRASRFIELLGLVFSATPPSARPERNRQGMRATLARLKEYVEN